MASESDPNNVTLGLVATPPTVFDAPSAEPGPGNRKYLPSLAEQVEQKIFEELSNYIQKESKESVFAVGGSIPITSLDDHLICESDDTASEGDDGIHEQHLSKEYTEFLVSRAGPGLDGPGHGFTSIAQPNVNALGTSSHRMRCEPITIRWDSNTHASASHKVSLPVKDEERPMFEQLLKDCSPASFGRGGKDVVDESYRKAGKLDVSAFCTSFNPHALGIVETAAQALVLSNKTQTNETHGIRAELYKCKFSASSPQHNCLLSIGICSAIWHVQGSYRHTPLRTPDRIPFCVPFTCPRRRSARATTPGTRNRLRLVRRERQTCHPVGCIL